MRTNTALARERRAAAAAFRDLPRDAPTLCGTWTAHDLLVHLVAQDDLRGLPVLITTPLVVLRSAHRRDPVRRAVLTKRERQLTNTDTASLARALTMPPPLLYRLPGIATTRLIETWVHHEDARRVDEPAARTSDGEIDHLLWRATRMIAAGGTVPDGVRLELTTPSGAHATIGRGDAVTVRGAPGELLLFLLGRQRNAHVTVEASARTMSALENGRPLV